VKRNIYRAGVVVAAAAVSIGAATSSASAHDCIIPMNTLKGPASANWFTLTAQDGALFIAGFEPECEAQTSAGYAALRAEKLPVALRIFEQKTIGEGSSNPNLGNGKGLENFESSPLPEQMVTTFVAGASSASC
jgi:hypothetical protein